ncbi:MAG: hypothetical protein ACJAUG_000737 [Halioglobus sp.]|jgi:hypothetical protein
MQAGCCLQLVLDLFHPFQVYVSAFSHGDNAGVASGTRTRSVFKATPANWKFSTLEVVSEPSPSATVSVIVICEFEF